MSKTNIMPFKFWCHKILPLVYDDSLSYYEFLCKIAKVVNDISEHNEKQDEAIGNLNQELSNLDNEVHHEIVPSLERKIGDVDTKINNVDSNLLLVAKRICAAPFSPEHIYLKGDYCVYYNDTADENETLKKGNLYKSKNMLLESGNFNPNDWEEVSVSKELKIAFNLFDSLISSLSNRYYTAGEYLKDDIVNYDNRIWICKETTSGEFEPSKWEECNLNKFVEMMNVIKANFEAAIASEYKGYDGEVIRYPRYSVVWYNGNLYRADEEVVVDSTSVLPPNENLKWNRMDISDMLLTNAWTIDGVNTSVENLTLEIASNYIGYSGAPIFYKKGSIVWYNNVLYKALNDITVASESVLPPSDNSDWNRTNIAENLGVSGGDTFDASIIAPSYSETYTYMSGDVVTRDGKLYICTSSGTTGVWDSSRWSEESASFVFAPKEKTERNIVNIQTGLGVPIDLNSVTKSVPKYTIGYDQYGIIHYAVNDTTTGSGYNPNDWDRMDNLPNSLFDWVQMQIASVNRYSEVMTNSINSSVQGG